MTSTLFSQPETVEQFSALAEKIKSENYFRAPVLFGIGREMRTGSGTLASMRYPAVSGLGQNLGTAAILQHVLHSLGVLDTTLPIASVPISTDLIDKMMGYFRPFEGDGKRHVNIIALRKMIGTLMRGDAQHIQGKDRPVVTFIFEDVAPQGVEDATLKLYGLSLRHFRPNSLNLDKIFTKLPNVAWIGDKVYDKDDVDQMLIEAAFGDTPFSPHMVDKFPLYIHRINAIDMGVRITDQHKVRLGAYLGEGTTLMPGASYVNFNAGTDGGMIEGRISSS
ncbi:MAG: tetrahydrodipicolinate N-succinyltransferase N-terminal domain-containing protein, partial [Patescibacteria group bacterium]